MSVRRRSGFTWVELLVIICVLALLLAMLLPAIQETRTPGRRNICHSNLHNLALSTTGYVSAKGEFPG